MLDFNFKNPTNILFGKGKIAAIKECIPAESRVLILYGRAPGNHIGCQQENFGT